MPFLWGSSQLVESPELRPASINNADVVARAAPASL
jgi:hypothetical protein